MQVLGNKVLLRAIKKEDVLGRDEIDYYEVAHIGTGLDLYDGQIKVGDKVIYQHGVTVTIEGEDYKLVNEEELVAII